MLEVNISQFAESTDAILASLQRLEPVQLMDNNVVVADIQPKTASDEEPEHHLSAFKKSMKDINITYEEFMDWRREGLK